MRDDDGDEDDDYAEKDVAEIKPTSLIFTDEKVLEDATVQFIIQ